ncbi:MAG: hypothetical protein AAF901_00285 [Bacteroidota bacterium]
MTTALCSCYYTFSQSNNLTGSPYSLFGLGVESNSNTGRNSALGRTGISLDANRSINLFNPASFTSIEDKRFLFDFGLYTEIQSITSDDGNESRFATNFSNMAFAFSIDKKSGVGLSLTPATSVGYALIGIESNIEGSNETFESNVTGSGGLNDIRVDYARKLNDKLSLGGRFSYLFGTIEETESVITGTSLLSVNEDNNYSGVQFGLGAQYLFKDKYSFGATIDFPTQLGASKDISVDKISNFAFTEVEESLNESIDDFYLPLRLGFGFSTTFKGVLIAADYKRNFWSDTNQSDEIGDYVDQNIFSVGAEYIPNANSFKYWNRVNYRFGFNYNSGNLRVDGITIDNYNASIGFGFPLNSRNTSFINLSYAFGTRGTTDNILVEENFNTINLNISLSDLWFIQRKYN